MKDDHVNIALTSNTSNTINTSNEERVTVVRRRKRDDTRIAEDAKLVAACRQGDHKAMEALYYQYRRRVYGLVTRIAGPSDADEVSQEVFVRIYRGLPKFRGDSQLGTWIYRLAVNAALSYVSRRSKRVHKGDEAIVDIAAPNAPGRDPRLAERLEHALDELPPGYRAVLVLHDIEGLSHEECAEIMGCRIGTSKSQLHKARARMRELLGPQLATERARARGEVA